MAAISSVFTIARVAEMLGEDEDLLHEVSLDMEPEDGVLWIYGVRGEEVLAFLPSASKTCATSSPSTKNPPLGLERPVTFLRLPCEIVDWCAEDRMSALSELRGNRPVQAALQGLCYRDSLRR